VLAFATSCSDSKTTTPTAPTPSPAPSPDATARYRVTFDASWSAATHPNMFPGNPHFSDLIGATHRAGVRFWQRGEIASNGIEAMAELGSTTPLDSEIQNRIDAGRAEHLLSGGGIARSPGSVSLDFEISVEMSSVTLVSMLAPSPDWFVGVDNLSLMDDGDWVDELAIELNVYDAGTDDGTTFDSPDRDTRPREPIARITTPPLATGGVAPPVGTFTFRRQ
jgi:hypothetical protein